MSRLTPVPLLVLALGLGGCGGDGEEGAGSPAAPAGQGTRVTLDDYSITPKALVVRRGTTVTATNEGKLAHNFTVERGSDPETDADDLAATETFVAGDTKSVRLDLPPGRYVTVCTVGNHRELGMVGTVTVK